MGPILVLDDLYLCALNDIMEHCNASSKTFHVAVTVDSKPLGCELASEFFIAYKHIPMLDLTNEDLLGHIDDAVAFIDLYRNEHKAVVVHCNAGQSRSAAVVIAYLMWKLQMGYDDSLQYLKKLKHDVRPNEGFEEQLRMYEYMGWKLDKTSKVYRQYQLERISEMVSSGRTISQLGELLSGAMQSSSNQSTDSVTYKCRKCRLQLFVDSNLLSHMAGAGDAAFSRPWQKVTRNDDVECKASLFIEPMKWMERLGLSGTTGKISCIKCAAKIGSWCWSGERCSCGTWVTPAFKIDVKKVDKSLSVRLPGK